MSFVLDIRYPVLDNENFSNVWLLRLASWREKTSYFHARKFNFIDKIYIYYEDRKPF